MVEGRGDKRGKGNFMGEIEPRISSSLVESNINCTEFVSQFSFSFFLLGLTGLISRTGKLYAHVYPCYLY